MIAFLATNLLFVFYLSHVFFAVIFLFLTLFGLDYFSVFNFISTIGFFIISLCFTFLVVTLGITTDIINFLQSIFK